MSADESPSAIAAGLLAQLVAAWNTHDMAAFASQFHDDAAFVNVAGAYRRGRADIERMHAAAHATFFRGSTLTAELLDVAAVATGVLLAHASSTVRGDDRAPDRTRESIFTLVISQREGEWKILAAHNTNVIPPPG